MGEKQGVPMLLDKEDYPLFKKKVEAWEILTTLDDSKRGLKLAVTIRCKVISAELFSRLTVTEMNVAGSVKVLIKELDKICLANTVEGVFTAIEKLECFKRGESMSIVKYLDEFTGMKRMVEECMPRGENGAKKDCSDSILAYRLMKHANLVESEELMVRAHLTELTSDAIIDVLKRIYGDRKVKTASTVSNSTITFDPSLKIKEEQPFFNENEDCYYGYNNKPYVNKRYYGNEPRRPGNPSNTGNKKNPLQRNGKVSKCSECYSEYHWRKDCPKLKSTKMTYFVSQLLETDFEESEEDLYFASSVANMALLDTGAPSTVCGESWYNIFLESLTPAEKLEVREEKCEKIFRFGDGKSVASKTMKIIPIRLCGHDMLLRTHMIQQNIPLLLSRDAMEKMKCIIDLKNVKFWIENNNQDLIKTDSGHVAVAIGRSNAVEKGCKDVSCKDCQRIFMLLSSQKTPRQRAEHIHRYFAHASSAKISEIVKQSTLPDRKEIIEELWRLDKSCEVCMKHKRESPRRRVALPQGKIFNDVVALDLKQLSDKSLILHAVDTLTRYSGVVPIKSKSANEIVEKLFQIWISIFGRPAKFISDNGGEFINHEFMELCMQFGIQLQTSPSESPWCQGIVERHNAIIGQMIDKVMNSTGCNRGIACCWAMNAKNTLSNIHGFSPHFLVFGRNPVIPDILNTESLSMLNESTSSRVVAEHLNAMHTSRKAFMEVQNSDILKRAFKQRIYQDTTAKFVPGDEVYWKREEGNFVGPATVVGQLGNQVLIWNFGRVVKINPSRVKMILRDEAREKLGVIGKSLPVSDDRESPCQEGDHRGTPMLDAEVECDTSSEDSDEDKDPIDRGTNEVPDPSESELGSHPEEVENNPREAESYTQVIEGEETGFSTEVEKQSRPQEELERPETENQSQNQEEQGEIIGNQSQSPVESSVEISVKTQMKSGQLTEKDTVYLTKTVDAEVQKAKTAELDRFKQYLVYLEVKDRGQFAVSTKWVVTQKGNKTKARLVARGFEEMKSNVTDSPTAATASKRIMLMLTASHGWKLEALDIAAAFLQADAMMRDVLVRPPSDIRKSGVLWQLNKPMYGLEDSSRQWYLTLKQTLLDLNCTMSKLDKSLFMYYEENKFQGVLVTHVDDIIFGGTTKFKNNVIAKLADKFKISRMVAGIFEYLGWNIEQSTDHITVDQRSYAEEIKRVELQSLRKNQLDDLLDKNEVTLYQKLLGKLLWLSCQTRPDLTFDTMEHSMYNKKPTVRNLMSLNKVVKKIPDGPKNIRFNKLDIKKGGLKIVFYADASLGNLGKDKTDSGRGYVIFLTDDHGICGVVDWSANKIKRKVQSVLGAETLAFQDALSAAIYIRAILSEVIFGDSESQVISLVGVSDSRQLVDSINSTKQCTEQRLRMNMAVIQEALVKDGLQMMWTESKLQLADSLTKGTADPRNLCLAVETGNISEFVF